MKISYAAILALGSAGEPRRPADLRRRAAANPITTVFRARTLGFQRNLAQAFDSIPESKFGYKPTPAQLTIGYIAQHLASDNYFFCNNFGAMKATLPAKDTDDRRLRQGEVAQGHARREAQGVVHVLRGRLRPARRREAGRPDHDDVRRPIAQRRTRASMVLGHALDMADHYSQLANYMRLNNILPPTALPRPGRGGD